MLHVFRNGHVESRRGLKMDALSVSVVRFLDKIRSCDVASDDCLSKKTKATAQYLLEELAGFREGENIVHPAIIERMEWLIEDQDITRFLWDDEGKFTETFKAIIMDTLCIHDVNASSLQINIDTEHYDERFEANIDSAMFDLGFPHLELRDEPHGVYTLAEPAPY